MAVSLNPDAVSIEVKTDGVKPAIHVGQRSFLMHLTRNVNLACVDSVSGKPRTLRDGHAIRIVARALLAGDPKSTADKIATSEWSFGLIQVARVITYDVGYAGRTDAGGSVAIDFKPGFDPNPSFDGPSPAIDDILDEFPAMPTPTTGPKPGFRMEIGDGDNPSTLLDLRLTNRTTGATNFVHSARRREDFVSYFVARGPDRVLRYLARVGWHMAWDATFQWTAESSPPKVTMRSSFVEVGGVVMGAPPADDAHGAMGLNPHGDSTNDMDAFAVDAALSSRSPRFYTESATRSSGLPAGFFP